MSAPDITKILKKEDLSFSTENVTFKIEKWDTEEDQTLSLKELSEHPEEKLSYDQKNEKKRIIRLEKNRRAAVVSRRKKKMYIKNLEERAARMAKHIAILEMENNQFRGIIHQLSNQLGSYLPFTTVGQGIPPSVPLSSDTLPANLADHSVSSFTENTSSLYMHIHTYINIKIKWVGVAGINDGMFSSNSRSNSMSKTGSIDPNAATANVKSATEVRANLSNSCLHRSMSKAPSVGIDDADIHGHGSIYASCGVAAARYHIRSNPNMIAIGGAMDTFVPMQVDSEWTQGRDYGQEGEEEGIEKKEEEEEEESEECLEFQHVQNNNVNISSLNVLPNKSLDAKFSAQMFPPLESMHRKKKCFFGDRIQIFFDVTFFCFTLSLTYYLQGDVFILKMFLFSFEIGVIVMNAQKHRTYETTKQFTIAHMYVLLDLQTTPFYNFHYLSRFKENSPFKD
ncbi:hypothetical protein RFI_01193 [Reticulomyxa filosa]|uniref:BZIP domain-containing protein n=1 Tax=Reticulomyxa filosa TaxID=46433 RepID=X6PDZ0_RETFI|nr:hypothetical protein RFI_01193 [Reticulomyxa filosa]|eukprot:ETO35867.1 hypothetical protein RFI_01193 [Reticulomyxa filosa]